MDDYSMVNAFRAACGKFPTGVTVTTVIGEDGKPYGITLSSFTSVSLTPLLVLVCIDYRSRMMQHLEVGKPIGINILSEHQQGLSRQFSQTWEKRFENMQWQAGEMGVPVLADACAVLECKINEMTLAGDHYIILAEVVNTASNNHLPLAYVNGSYVSGSLLQAFSNSSKVF